MPEPDTAAVPLAPEPDTEAVRLAIDDGVATITLDAPGRGNRLTVGAMLALIGALERATDEATVLVLRATGDDFTFGRDQSERRTDITRAESLRLILRANALLGGFPGVSVALVQGHALGFGSGLALHSDIAIAADDATLGFDEVLHGLAPLVVVAYLPEHVGRKVATELVMTGRPVPAREALELRMVNRLVPSAELASAGADLVAHLRRQPAGALRLMKAYRLDHEAGALTDPGLEAVDRLDAWIAAGKPDDVPRAASSAAAAD
jgi:enoyl-CoA hydratase/carnithine racemase